MGLPAVDIVEIDAGLWRWSTRHPEWSPGAKASSAADWPPDVGSVAFAASDAVVLVDPLVPAEPDVFWRWLDGLVAEQGPRVAVLTTIKWHRRSRDEVAARYGASTSRARDRLPKGVETIPIRRAGETMVWLPGPRALVPGDRLLGDGRGGLRLSPASWIAYLPSKLGRAQLREAMRPLLDLPVERVLVSHGEPVLRGGRAAIARAIGG
jgi:hypothetical protein